MKRSDLPKFDTTAVVDKTTGRVGFVPQQLTNREQENVYGYTGYKKTRSNIALKDRETGELFLAEIKDLVYEPDLEYPEINWGPHSVSYFGDINLELWVAFPEFPTKKWYGVHTEGGYRKDGGISEFIGWLEKKYDRDTNNEHIFGSRGGWRIYYCTVYIERLPCSLNEFMLDVESKIAELI